jgi:hypothetical protein
MRFICRLPPPKLLSHVIASAERQNNELDQRKVYFASKLQKEIREWAITPHNHQNNATAALILLNFCKCNLFLLFVDHAEDMAASIGAV